MVLMVLRFLFFSIYFSFFLLSVPVFLTKNLNFFSHLHIPVPHYIFLKWLDLYVSCLMNCLPIMFPKVSSQKCVTLFKVMFQVNSRGTIEICDQTQHCKWSSALLASKQIPMIPHFLYQFFFSFFGLVLFFQWPLVAVTTQWVTQSTRGPFA